MIDRAALLSDLQKLLKRLEADLLERSQSTEIPEVGAHLRQEFEEATEANRTAQTFDEWRSDDITQTAAAWVLSCVFVRFLEDNALIDPPRIAGPGERLQRARDEHELYFRANPTLNDRDYLIAVFDRLEELPPTRDVFGAHNPIHDIPNWLSGDAAGELLRFFQRIEPNTGALAHDFTDPSWDTRFLGDLYQDLSEEARKLYALLQTPVFVEEFILDRSLDPAIEEFGLARLGYETRLEPDGRLHPDDRFKMIDPACGSGHFLLGSLARLIERWRKKEPGAMVTVLVQRALDSVHGVDVNPYAIAIARFRLLLAALKDCGVWRLSDAPGFEIHLTCGDSLLHGSPGGDQQTMGWAPTDHVYQPEDRGALERLLRPKTYHAVVANPPYITPKDSALNAAYRERYRTCHRQYSLAVPFLERIVSLAAAGGYTGQITANSFMKREFGKKLIEVFFSRIDLTHVIDTSKIAMPSHGTSTVILLARNQLPVSRHVRAVFGIRGEPPSMIDPSLGKVWRSIMELIDRPGSQSEYISVVDTPRAAFLKHPWSIGGGGAAELKERLDEGKERMLSEVVDEIGFLVITGEDNCLLLPRDVVNRATLTHWKPLADGEMIRDWQCVTNLVTLWPNTDLGDRLPPDQVADHLSFLWRYRTVLKERRAFSVPVEQKGIPWWCLRELYAARLRTPLSIAFAFVATHNHFVLDRGGKVFNRSAPVIKLPSGATEDAHLALLGILNSSTACFWMKQVFYNKGAGGVNEGFKQEEWEQFREFAGTSLNKFPLPKDLDSVRSIAGEMDSLSCRLHENSPVELVRTRVPTREILNTIRSETDSIRTRMVALQEELDWLCYKIYDLLPNNDPEAYKLENGEQVPGVALGQRAFEFVLARRMASGELQTAWFERHGSSPITELPRDWPNDYRETAERRIELIENDPNIGLIEQPDNKRRWNTEPWADQLARALRSWLLDRLESYFDFDGRMNDAGTATARLGMALTSVARLADVARQDPEFHQVGELYRDDPAFDIARLVAELVEAESVPLLPVLRYKPSSLRKRDEWDKTWALQRQEDSIDARTKLPKDHSDYLTELDAKALKKKQVGNIPVPPRYTSVDFLKGDYWRLRGKLDVPKERWVSFPHCEGPDGTLIVAWAGYDHLQLARAISAYYVDVQERLGGRDDPRLIPLLACLIELLPWLKQWHNEIDPEFGVPMGDYFEGFIQEEARQLGKTIPEIKAWEPQRTARRSRKSGTSTRSAGHRRGARRDSEKE
jgi:hypothetical protein